MSVNLPNHFTQQYSSNVSLLLQEKGPKLRPFVMVGSHVGKRASPVNQYGAVSMKKVTSRFTEKTRTDSTAERRWVVPSDYSLDQMIDSFDELKTIVDPKSPYAQNAALAAGRQFDDLIIDAALGDATTGEDAGSTESFDTGNYQISVSFNASGDVGLTVEKLIEARKIWREANVDLDMEEQTLVIGPQQESDLLRQTEIVSKDYNDKPVLVDGRLSRFLGFNIIVSNRLSVASSHRSVLAFVKSGMYLGIWEDVMSDAHQRFDLEANPWELTTLMSGGSTRLEQGKVLEILCQE